MTDLTTIAATAARRSEALRLRLPKLAIGARVVAVAMAVGAAFKLGYVDPYAQRRSDVVAEDGRDPSW